MNQEKQCCPKCFSKEITGDWGVCDNKFCECHKQEVKEYCNCGKYGGGAVLGGTFYCANCGKERTPSPKPEPNWEIEFRKKFVDNKREDGPIYTSELRDDHIIAYIYTILAKDRESLIAKVEGMSKTRYHDKSRADGKDMGYNQALSEVIEILKTPLG